MSSCQSIDSEGRCTLHPTIQVKINKGNGEWRLLLNACPLCVSGLPAYGQTVPTRPSQKRTPSLSTRETMTSEHINKPVKHDASTRTFGQEPWQDDTGEGPPSGRTEVSTGHNKEVKPLKTRHPSRSRLEATQGEVLIATKRDANRTGAPKKERPLPPAKQGIHEATSLDKRENDDDPDSLDSKTGSNYDSFIKFLQEDKSKHLNVPLQPANNPKPPARISKPTQEEIQQQNDAQVLTQRHPPPPPQTKMQQHAKDTNFSLQKQTPVNYQFLHTSPQIQHASFTHLPYCPPPPKRPDPESVDIRGLSIRHQEQQHHLEIPAQSSGNCSNQSSQYQTQRVHTTLASKQQQEQDLHQKMVEQSAKPIEQDEVSVISMSSVVRNMHENPHTSSEKSDSEDEPRIPPSQVNSSSKKNIQTKEIETAAFDAKGKCVHHPNIRLRKKKLFGGWQIVLSNCPECCLNEMRRLKEERGKDRPSGGRGETSLAGNSKGSKGSKKKKKTKNPPINQVNVKSASGCDDDKSIGTASTITNSSSFTHSTGSNRNNGQWQNFVSDNDSNGKFSNHDGLTSARVTRMPYTDQNGECGWYTGDVNATSGTPHGRGIMNYSNGAVCEGEWINGMNVVSRSTRQEEMINNGVNRGANIPLRHHGQQRNIRPQRSFQHPTPRMTLETHYETGGSGSSTGSQAMSIQLESKHDKPRRVVCGMPWSDGNGGVGSYTGEVSSLNIPDGMGSMRYSNGIVSEGVWTDGEIEDDMQDDETTSVRSYQSRVRSRINANSGTNAWRNEHSSSSSVQ